MDQTLICARHINIYIRLICTVSYYCAGRNLDEEIRDVVREQKSEGGDGKESLQDAQLAIQELFSRIKDIKTRSEKSEEMVSKLMQSLAVIILCTKLEINHGCLMLRLF